MSEPRSYAELAEQFGLSIRDIQAELQAAIDRGASRDELRKIVGLPPIDRKAE